MRISAEQFVVLVHTVDAYLAPTWRSFERVLKKAISACENSNQDTGDHFVQVDKMVKLGSGSEREILDYALSQYVCYLIVQNGDPSKPVIANGQTYFAIQTRKQELANDADFQRLEEMNNVCFYARICVSTAYTIQGKQLHRKPIQLRMQSKNPLLKKWMKIPHFMKNSQN